MALGEYERGGNGHPVNDRAGIGRCAATHAVMEGELLQLLITGLTLKEAASHMRASYTVIRRVAKDPAFLLKVRDSSGEIAKRMVDELANSQIAFSQKLEEASEAALEEMITMMKELPGPSTLKKNICTDLLDRDARASRTKRVDGTLAHDFVSPAVLIHAAATAKELEEYERKKLNGGNGNSTDHPADS